MVALATSVWRKYADNKRFHRLVKNCGNFCRHLLIYVNVTIFDGRSLRRDRHWLLLEASQNAGEWAGSFVVMAQKLWQWHNVKSVIGDWFLTVWNFANFYSCQATLQRWCSWVCSISAFRDGACYMCIYVHTAWGLVARFDKKGNAKASYGGAGNSRASRFCFY